jgi:hypothetical protein
MAAIPALKVVAPSNKKRRVGRKANAKYRTREHLTEREVERLVEAAKARPTGVRSGGPTLGAGGPKRRRPARPQSQTGHSGDAPLDGA